MFSWARFLRPASVLVLILACTAAIPAIVNAQPHQRRLDHALSARARTGAGESRVIVTFKAGRDASADARRFGATLGRRLRNGSRVMHLSNTQLEKLANHPAVEKIRWDRPVFGLPVTESSARSAESATENLRYTGEGVGVAIIDSGVTPWHDELTYSGTSPHVLTKGGQRVAAFFDYVNCTPTETDPCLREPYDDYGHGTYVAGIIAGNGVGSNGVRQGSAPHAHLVVAKVLDGSGRGTVSDVIDALDAIRTMPPSYNIRVVNMSIAAAVLHSFEDDPLAEATRRAVEAGIVVVAAAGNLGANALGQPQYGGITAPGNAPWVLTVGAYDQNGNANPRDDVISSFSSRGPTAYDFQAKPDVVAPGAAIVSPADPTSNLYARKVADFVGGAGYLSLSGTSVAAPAVSGTVALMVQANPAMTPNLAKAVIQYTASFDPDYDVLTQGGGYLNTAGAVELSRYFARARAGDPYPRGRTWSRRIIWGNYLIGGGVLWPNANAWATSMPWGSTADEEGDNIVWGTLCAPEDCDNIVWGTFEDLDNIVWGTDEDGDNIVWGTACREPGTEDADEDCDIIVWGTTEDEDNIVWGTCADEDCDNIVWGTMEDVDNIVWGTDCGGEDCDNIVWGTLTGEDIDNIVWGTAEDIDNIVWGTSCTGAPEDCDNIVWGTEWDDPGGFNIVWGTTLLTTSSVAAAPAPHPTKARKHAARGSSRR
jgi:serine protease AprX